MARLPKTGRAKRNTGPADAPPPLPETIAAEDTLAADVAPGDVGPREFPCENCGALLAFSPGMQALHCDYCDHDNEIAVSDDTEILEQDLQAVLQNQADAAPLEVHHTAKCSSCAASFDMEAQAHADACPFCGSTVVVDTGDQHLIKPQGVVPFAIDQTGAKNRVRRWLRGLWFAPDAVKEFTRETAEFNGMYVPYWTFDSDTLSSWAGHRGDDYTVQVKTKDGFRSETRTRWTAVSGSTQLFFDDVLVLASHSLPQKITNRLAPWDLSALKPYLPAFLTGFRSEAYQVSVAEGTKVAQAEMDRGIESAVRRQIGGDRQRISWVRTKHRDETFKHILLPVWISAFSFRGKTYRYVVNGQTGRVQGERPWSPWKIAFAVVCGLIIGGICAALYVLAQG